jgi:stage III sporulation protein SpoIIIAA
MLEAVQNHTPHVVVVDEIGTAKVRGTSQSAASHAPADRQTGVPTDTISAIAACFCTQEVAAARSIAHRGVSLIASAHGTDVASLLANPVLVSLLGGVKVHRSGAVLHVTTH